MNLLVGADPEVFVRKDGQLVSAHNMVPGTKENPHPVENGAVQVDGMALEFNIDPASSEEIWVNNIESVMSQLRTMAEAELVVQPVAEFGRELIEAQPEEAKELGCEADYNAYAGSRNDPPNGELPFRTAAGHIHLGFLEKELHPEMHFSMCCGLTQQLDCYLGLPSLLFDTDDKRRELYGKAGAFRPKPYGMEYRVLSNVWLGSPGLIRWAYRNTVKAFESMHNPETRLFRKIGSLQRVIDSGDRGAAKRLCEEYSIDVPEVANVG